MEFLGKLEFGPVIKPHIGMFVAYSGEYNNNVRLPYRIANIGEQTKLGQSICLENDQLEVPELFFIDISELQEILCTFDMPTTDITIKKDGLYKAYKVEYRSFESLEELTYVLSEGLEEIEVSLQNEKVKIMGKTHIVSIDTVSGETKPVKRSTITSKFEEIFHLLGIQAPTSNTINDLKVIVEQLKTVGYIPYPVSLSTVDIVPYYINEKGSIFLLMGRKPGQTKFQFIGGFRDPQETNEIAARREFIEEACIDVDENRLKFHKTIPLNDRRYKDSVHKITTALFTVEITYNEAKSAKGCDDIEEIQLWSLQHLMTEKENVIRDVHYGLFDEIVNIFS